MAEKREKKEREGIEKKYIYTYIYVYKELIDEHPFCCRLLA